MISAVQRPLEPALGDRLCGRPFLLLLDVDGTLAPIAPRPDYATIPPATQDVVRELLTLPHTHVALVSGRAALDARRMLGFDATWVLGNHGIEVAAPHTSPIANVEVERYAPALATAAERCSELAIRTVGLLVEDKRWTLSVHYRLAHPQIVPGLVIDVAAIAQDLGLRMMQGKEVLELRPPVHIDKGTASVELARRVRALDYGASILCAGDDRTDEDAFTAVRGAQPRSVTVRVGTDWDTARSAAEFGVGDTDEMRALLEEVVALRGGSAR